MKINGKKVYFIEKRFFKNLFISVKYVKNIELLDLMIGLNKNSIDMHHFGNVQVLMHEFS